jgi:hypothetical protein
VTGLEVVISVAKNVTAGTNNFQQANCPAGKIAIAGGSITDPAQPVSTLHTIGSYNLGFFGGATPNASWVVEVVNQGAADQTFRVQATCVDAAVLGLGPVRLAPKPASKGARPGS